MLSRSAAHCLRVRVRVRRVAVGRVAMSGIPAVWEGLSPTGLLAYAQQEFANKDVAGGDCEKTS